MKNYIRKLWLILLFACVNFGMNSCIIIRERPVSRPRTVIIFRRVPSPSHPRHPHGGPPGQTKKRKGHPGKRF